MFKFLALFFWIIQCIYDKPEKNLIPGSRVASVYLFVEEVQCQLQPDCFHVSLLQCRGDVHVHVEKMPHDSVLFRLLDFQLREQFDEPFERLLVTIYPEEVHLLSKERKKINFFTCVCIQSIEQD